MDDERITLDNTHFEYLVLGTDMAESVTGAALASRGHSTMNVDSDHLYSGTLKALNLKEFQRWLTSLDELKKDSLVRNVHVSTNQTHFLNLQDAINKVGFRAYTIDLDPKLLYSNSPATNDLISIGIDNYTSFKAVKAMAFYQNGTFAQLPVTKSLIVKCQFLSLKEKKAFLENLERLQKFNQNFVDSKNVNSTNEFEKELYDNPKSVSDTAIAAKIDSNCNVIFDELLQGNGGDKFKALLAYCLCNRLGKKDVEKMTGRELLAHFQKFVKSAGMHDVFPYLTSSYGAGDITQVFSRISALHGSVFLIGPNYEIVGLEEMPKGGFLCRMRQGTHEHLLTVNRMVIGRQFQGVVSKLLGLKTDSVEHRLTRLICVVKNEAHSSDDALQLPFIGVIPDNQPNFPTSNPIRIFMSQANPNQNDGNYVINAVWESIESSVETRDSLVLSQSIVEAVTSDINKFTEVKKGVFFAPNFESELTIDPYLSSVWSFLDQTGQLSDKGDRLIRKAVGPNEHAPEQQNEESELLTKLEQFKFS